MSQQKTQTPETPETLRVQMVGYALATVFFVVASVASWLLTDHPAGLTSLPLAVVFGALGLNARQKLHRLTSAA